jgi:hypothetical protein
MRTPLLALIAATLGAGVLAPAPALAAKPGPDLPEVRTTVALEVTGEWSGRMAFGTHTSGAARAQRPMPLEMLLSRTACDMAGCMTTEIVVDQAAAVPGVARIATGLSSAALDRASISVTVRRIINGSVIAEHPAMVTLQVRAKRTGAVIKRTTLTQGPGGEVLTMSRIATVRASVLLGDDTLAATGEITRTQIVD